MNDAIRDLGVEVQPSHLEQNMNNLIEKSKETLGQGYGHTPDSVRRNMKEEIDQRVGGISQQCA